MITLQLLRCAIPGSIDPLAPPADLVADLGQPSHLDCHIVLPFLFVVVFAIVIAGFARLIDNDDHQSIQL
jgi:hypothetical protein